MYKVANGTAKGGNTKRRDMVSLLKRRPMISGGSFGVLERIERSVIALP